MKYKNPPSRVKLVMQGVFLILKKSIKNKLLTWKQIKWEMNSGDFIKSVLEIDVS